MNSEAKKKVFVGVLFGVLGIVLVYQLFIKGTGPTPTTSTAAKKPATAAKATATAKAAANKASAASAGAAQSEEDLESSFQNVEVDIDTLLQEIEVVNFDYEAEHIDRNPMSPLVGIVRPQDGTMPTPYSAAGVMRKNVTGIIYATSDPAAVVDEEVVNEGYVYPDGTIVQDIEPDRVIFKVGDSLIPVEMKKIGAGQ